MVTHELIQSHPGEPVTNSLLAGPLLNRAFFITDNGGMGIGPKRIKEGDKIAFLYGASVPFVLRLSIPDELESNVNVEIQGEGVPGWNLVGECYLMAL